MRQVWTRKASESEPLMTRRKRIDDIKTEEESLPRDEPGGDLFTAQAVSGVKVARAWPRLCAERGNLRFDMVGRYIGRSVTRCDERETPKWQKPRGAEYRCGVQGRTAP